MLTITLPKKEEEVFPIKLDLEHSLVSMSKWEARFEKPFFNGEPKSVEETLVYVRHMVISDGVPDDLEHRITADHITEIDAYISSRQSATWFREDETNRRNSEIVTSELVYYWMIAFNIPSAYETWHLNRLFALIKICGIKQSPPKKMDKVSQHEMMRRLNEQRKRDLGTNG